ncbi:MAG: hypothetical protein Q9M36_13095, partial [Sulfurovum sp.]|nr:hypothetical protein [Sulfurovum sp.]
QIQKSTQYINNSLNIKIHKSIGKSSYGRGQSGSLDYNICEAYYYKPIPNSKKAKEIEITNFAKIIAVSLRRLNMHEKRLPILESQTSTILSFESTLKKMKKDLAFDMIDPLNTEAKLKKYDAFFNKSLRSLQEFKKELSVDIEVSPSEISEIKTILSKDYNENI